MSIYNYIKKDGNGKNVLVCDDLPAKGFIDAIKVQDICKMRIIGRKERDKIGLKQGDPDVIITSITGERRQITRQQLCKEYACTNGKKILLAFVRDSKDYIVKSRAGYNETYKILKLPNNCQAVLRNNRVQPGSYIICTADEQGNANVGNMYAVSSKMFKRMFKIPMQPVIEKSLGLGLVRKNVSKTTILSKELKQEQNNTSNINKPKANLQKTQTNNTEHTKYRFTAINKIVDNTGRIIGFTIQEIATNKTKPMTLTQVKQLCSVKSVSNIILVRNENTGQSYLKGNGIRLESLPKVLQ